MHIKLISPRVTLRPMDSAWKTRMSPPLSLLVLGALTPPEHRVTLADENVGRQRFGDSPALVGITVKVDTAPRAFAIADGYRRRGVPVVMGGIHPTVCPEDCLMHADAVVVGQAEHLWGAVLADAARGRLRPIYRNAGPVDPAATPIPRWDLLDHRKYLFTNTLTIGRGCPFRCDFCYNSSENIDARYRMKPIPQIVREIESLGVDHVMFIDDNFIGDPAGVRRLLPELRRLNLTWHTAVSADVGRHPDLLDAMASAGCRSLFIGFESVNERSLRECHKAQNRIGEYDETVRRIHARGMMVNASLVFGFDEDDESVFPATMEWLVRNRIATMTGHILTPYPGTRLHSRLLTEGRILDFDLSHYNTAHVVYRPARLSPEALAAGYRWMYRTFYSWPNLVRRWPVAEGQALAYLQFNLIYRKFGKVTSLVGRAWGMRQIAEFARRMAYPPGRQAHAVAAPAAPEQAKA